MLQRDNNVNPIIAKGKRIEDYFILMSKYLFLRETILMTIHKNIQQLSFKVSHR